MVRRLRRRDHPARDGVRAHEEEGQRECAAAGARHGAEPADPAGRHRPSGDGGEGGGRRAPRHEGRRHHRSEGRALRPDQDAAADHRHDPRCEVARPRRVLRGA